MTTFKDLQHGTVNPFQPNAKAISYAIDKTLEQGVHKIDLITNGTYTLGLWLDEIYVGMFCDGSLTFELDSNLYINKIILKSYNDLGEIESVKLVSGSNVTEWTPAPEDFNNLKGKSYSLSQPLRKENILSLNGSFEEDDFIGLWLGSDKFVGFLDNEELTFDLIENYNDQFVVVKALSEKGIIDNAKLELGSTPTEYSPAPEDGYGLDLPNGAWHMQTSGGTNAIKIWQDFNLGNSDNKQFKMKVKNFGAWLRVRTILGNVSDGQVFTNEYREIDFYQNSNIPFRILGGGVNVNLDFIASDPQIGTGDYEQGFNIEVENLSLEQDGNEPGKMLVTNRPLSVLELYSRAEYAIRMLEAEINRVKDQETKEVFFRTETDSRSYMLGFADSEGMISYLQVTPEGLLAKGDKNQIIGSTSIGELYGKKLVIGKDITPEDIAFDKKYREQTGGQEGMFAVWDKSINTGSGAAGAWSSVINKDGQFFMRYSTGTSASLVGYMVMSPREIAAYNFNTPITEGLNEPAPIDVTDIEDDKKNLVFQINEFGETVINRLELRNSPSRGSVLDLFGSSRIMPYDNELAGDNRRRGIVFVEIGGAISGNNNK